MTVEDNTSRNQYTATSGQTVFAYTFEIVDKDHIVVLQNGTALSEGTDYNVSNVGNDNGGNVTLTSGATAGDILTLYRDMPYSRTQNYTNSGDFLASEVNSDFDNLWLAGEQTERSFSQSIRKPITDSDSISMELPEAADRANKFIKFDSTGAVDVAGATVTVDAEDVAITDAGNYYTSGNVEGALQEVGASLDTKLENVVEDTTPQLGGNLDVNGNDITGTGNIDLTGNLDVSGTATIGAVTYTGTDGTDGQVLMTDGAGNASFEDMPSSTYLDVTDFGATGDGSDQTTELQNAINHASTRGIQTIFFPEGHYKYTTLRFYHDQTDNTGFQGTNLYIGDSTDGTDGTATFAFGWYIADEEDLTVTVEGVEQTLNTHYTVSGVGSDTGGTVTFTSGNVPLVPTTSNVTTRNGDGSTLEFFYTGEVIPGATNLSVTVGGVTSTDYTVDIGKRLVVFNAGFAPPSGTGNVVITIQKTVKISSNNRDGRFQLRGTGRLSISDLVSLDKNRTRIYGSVLETTGDGIIIDTDQEFGTSVDARNFVAKDLTFIGDNTGYLLKAEKNPGMSLDTCSFKQFNPDGNGIQPRNCWFFTMNQCYVVGQRHIDEFTAAGGIETFTYTFDSPAATSDIVVYNRGGALTETTDYTVNLGTQQVTLTASAAVSGDTISISRLNTGDGVSSQFVGRTFGSFAGLWTISQSLVDSFANGVRWTGGQVTNFSIRDSAIQNCNTYNIYADDGVVQQMLLDNVYFENQKVQGVNFIKGNGNGSTSAAIRNLQMTNNFMLGGGTHPRVTGACIDLDSIDVLNIEGMYHYRVRQTFLNVTDTKNNQNIPGEIKNSIFATDQDLSAESTIYLLTGLLPNVHNCVWPGFSSGYYNTTNDILLFDSTVEANFPRQYTDIKGTTGTAKFGFGDTKVVTVPEGSDTFAPLTPEDEFTYTFDSPDSSARIKVERKPSGGSFTETSDFTVNLSTKLVTLGTATASGEEVKISTGSPYNITGSNSRTYYDLTHSIAGGLKVILPDTGEVNDGRLIIIKNNEASTSTSQFPYINVVNNSAQNTTIGRLSPGQAGLFILDKQNSSKFKYVGRTFTDDLELTDNHKITFGRGTSAGPDMEIYHDSTSGESRIDTLAGLTLDGLTYPTADGTANQVLTTNGSGTLSFADAGGGFDPNVDNPAIGNGSSASATNGTAYGHDAVASGNNSTALGFNSNATATGAVAVGTLSDATNTYAISIGDSLAAGIYSVAIGGNAEATAAAGWGVALGYNAKAQAANTLHINSSSSQNNRPTVAGNLGIETDDARLQYKSSTWGFYRGDVEIQHSTPSLDLIDTDGTDTKGSVGFNGSALNLDARNGASDGPILFRGLGGGTATEYARFANNGALIMQLESIRMAGGSGTGVDLGGRRIIKKKIDDYEEGTLTTDFQGSTKSGTFTYSTQVGRYTKVGNVVNVTLRLVCSAASGATGTVYITGLPFSNNSSVGSNATIGRCAGFGGTNHATRATVLASGTALILYTNSTSDCRSSSATSLDASLLSSSAQIELQMTYLAS